jgi:6-phosphogluconolactonase/glucosamine-6-phosphate isomerase/deaminase
MHTVRQEFPKSDPLEIPAAVAEQISMVQGRLTPGKRVALTVGSRGIANIKEIVLAVLGELKAAGMEPLLRKPWGCP